MSDLKIAVRSFRKNGLKKQFHILKIVKQKTRSWAGSSGSDPYVDIDSNSIIKTLKSAGAPAYGDLGNHDNHTLYIRGIHTRYDHVYIYLPSNTHLEDVKRLVKAWNKKYGESECCKDKTPDEFKPMTTYIE